MTSSAHKNLTGLEGWRSASSLRSDQKALRRLRRKDKVLRLAVLWLLSLGCAGSFDPRPASEVGFRSRSESQKEGGVRLSAAVPSAKETRALFSTNLYRQGIQPVWLEIENGRDEHVAFLPASLDPAYYSPVEAATRDLVEIDRSRAHDKVAQYFLDQQLGIFVEGGKTRSGFIFTKLDEGTKAFNVDILTEDSDLIGFTFYLPVPGLEVDHSKVDWNALYPDDAIVDYDRDGLIEAIENLPCCATDKAAKGSADPLNLVVLGEIDDVYYAFLRAGWDETETTHRGSAWKTVKSFFSGGEYRYSPVSRLYVFGRGQDVAFQKARDNIHERNHLRLWLSNMRYQGKPVWLGQISRDIGVRFTAKTITTHKIDPDVDETREFLLEDLAYAQALGKMGYVGGVGVAPLGAPRHNLTGDPYFTDGDRVVLWIASEPTDINEIDLLDFRPQPE